MGIVDIFSHKFATLCFPCFISEMEVSWTLFFFVVLDFYVLSFLILVVVVDKIKMVIFNNFTYSQIMNIYNHIRLSMKHHIIVNPLCLPGTPKTAWFLW